MIGRPDWYVPVKDMRDLAESWPTINFIPGTARSKLRAFNKLGETYCRSRVVSCGNCFSTFLNTYRSDWYLENSDANQEKRDLLHSKYPKPYPIHLCRHKHDTDDRLLVLREVLGQTLVRMRSLLQW